MRLGLDRIPKSKDITIIEDVSNIQIQTGIAELEENLRSMPLM
jgi:hypothetical protein